MARNTSYRGGGAPPAMPARTAGTMSGRTGGGSFGRGGGGARSGGMGGRGGGGHMCSPGQPCGTGLAPRADQSPVITVQPWTTVIGASTTGDFIQPFDRYGS